MRFDKIKIKNFMAIGDAEIELSGQGFVSITGRNYTDIDNADGNVSNGSGKSSLAEAVAWVLSGQTIRGTKDVQNYYTKDECSVEVWFESRENKYRICRTKGKSLEIYENDKDISGKGIRETQEIIEAMFPEFDAEYLGATVLIGQGMPNAFTNNTGAKRKEILERLSKSDYQIEDIKNKLTAVKEKTNKELRSEEDGLLKAETEKGMCERDKENNLRVLALEQDIADGKKQIAELKLQAEQAEIDARRLTAACDNLVVTGRELADELNKRDKEWIEARNKALQAAQERVYAKEQARAEYETVAQGKKTDAENIVKNIQNEKRVQEQEYNNSVKAVSADSALAKISGQIDVLSQEIKRVENIKDVCPTCGRPFEGVHKPDTTAQQAQIEQLRVDYKKEQERVDAEIARIKHEWVEEENKYNSQVAKAEAARNDVVREIERERARLTTDVSAAKADMESEKVRWSVNPETRELSEQVQNCREEYKARKEESRRADEQRNKISRALSDKEKEIQGLEMRVAQAKESISRAEKRIEELSAEESARHKKIEQRKSKIETINKMYSYATKEFRTILLEGTIELLEKKAKRLCNVVFGTDKINFRQDGAGIFIGYRDKPLENLSGGEGQLVKLLIQLALRETLISLNGESYNMIWLDEIFDSLDEERAEKAVELASGLNTESIFIISHRSNLQLPSDREIAVEKVCDVATVKIVA